MPQKLRSFGKRTYALMRFLSPSTPRAARDFKRMYPAEFDMLKQDTQGRDFSDAVIEQLRMKYQTPFEWVVTENKHGHDDQRICTGDNDVIKLNAVVDPALFTQRQLRILQGLQYSSYRSNHPVDYLPLHTVGWVRYCKNPKTKTWLIEEIQSDVAAALHGLKNPKVIARARESGLEASEIEAVLAHFASHLDRLYEDALGITFQLARERGYSLEMLNYDTKSIFNTEEHTLPPGPYTSLPRQMGMKLSPGSVVLPKHKAIQQTWKITPNRRTRRTSRK